MAVLSLETTSRTSYVALSKNGKTLVEKSSAEQRGAEVLAELISRAMSDAAVGYDALEGVLVGIGPGSFTGIRTGLAAAAGLRAATGVPIRGISTLLAGCVLSEGKAPYLTPILRANDNESYICLLEVVRDANSPMIIRACGDVEAVKTERLASEERFRSRNGQLVEQIALDRAVFTGSEAICSPAALLARFTYDVDQSQSRFPALTVQRSGDQTAGGGILPEPLYIKAVHAKTLSERGIEQRSPTHSS